MVANGEVQPVWQQCVIGAAEYGPDISGVLARRVKVGVVTDIHRQVQLHFVGRQQYQPAQFGIIA